MLQTKTPAGARDQKIRIESPVIEDGVANSDEVASWSLVCEPYADIKFKQGHDSYQADRLTDQQTMVANIRYRSDVNTKMRIVFNGQWWRIFSVTEVGRRVSLDIAAEWVDNEIVT